MKRQSHNLMIFCLITPALFQLTKKKQLAVSSLTLTIKWSSAASHYQLALVQFSVTQSFLLTSHLLLFSICHVFCSFVRNLSILVWLLADYHLWFVLVINFYFPFLNNEHQSFEIAQTWLVETTVIYQLSMRPHSSVPYGWLATRANRVGSICLLHTFKDTSEVNMNFLLSLTTGALS